MKVRMCLELIVDRPFRGALAEDRLFGEADTQQAAVSFFHRMVNNAFRKAG
jgi:hypothetical protein